MGPRPHAIYLIPWHIGGSDVTQKALGLLRRLRVFLVEDVGYSRAEFNRVAGAGGDGKEFLSIPHRPDTAFLDRVLGLLAGEEVGLVASGGMPCFADPGGWLVRELRSRGAAITPVAGASALTTVLAMSGFDWLQDPPTRRFTFTFFEEQAPHDEFREAVARRFEPVVVFLGVRAFPACLAKMEDLVGKRPIAAFLDLTNSGPEFPYGDQVLTMGLKAWQAELPRIQWDKVRDMSLMIHPEAYRRLPPPAGAPPRAGPGAPSSRGAS